MNAINAPINVNLRGGRLGIWTRSIFWVKYPTPGTSYLVKTPLQLSQKVRLVSLKVATLSLKCCWYYKQAHQFCQLTFIEVQQNAYLSDRQAGRPLKLHVSSDFLHFHIAISGCCIVNFNNCEPSGRVLFFTAFQLFILQIFLTAITQMDVFIWIRIERMETDTSSPTSSPGSSRFS